MSLQATAHVRRLRGGAQAQLMCASDGQQYVVKLQNNPQHIRVLVNEFFVTRLAQKLGLPVPDVRVLEVPQSLIEQSNMRCQIAGAAPYFASGPSLASRYINHPDSLDYLPSSTFECVFNLDDFARALVLDKWLCNADGRQCIFSRPPRHRQYRVSFIDHGYCFNAGEWSFPDSPLRGVYAMNQVYAGVTGWRTFQPALRRAQEMSLDEIHDCTHGLPPAWYGHDADALQRLVESVYARRSRIADLVTDFRNSSRQPFPNWRSIAVRRKEPLAWTNTYSATFAPNASI